MGELSVFVFARRPASSDARSISFDRNIQDVISSLRDLEHYVELWQPDYDPRFDQILATAQSHKEKGRKVVLVFGPGESSSGSITAWDWTVPGVRFEDDDFSLHDALDQVIGR